MRNLADHRARFALERYRRTAVEPFFPRRSPRLLEANRHLCDVLRSSGHRVEYRELYSGHDENAWRAVLGDGIAAVLAHRMTKV